MRSIATAVGQRPRVKRILRDVDVWPLPDQLTGVEIEAERTPGAVFPNQTPDMWSEHGDGSLRNGVEYVLSAPLAGKELSYAIDTFYSNVSVERWPTSSTHIHIDMRDEDLPVSVLQSIFILAYTLEDCIYALGDQGRDMTGFCNKLDTLSAADVALIMRVDDESESLVPLGRGSRYYGLNLRALFKYGSLEFRYFPTAVSANELKSWIRLVQQFKAAAMALRTKEGTFEVFKDEAAFTKFVDCFFSEWRDTFGGKEVYLRASRLAHVLRLSSSYYDARSPGALYCRGQAERVVEAWLGRTHRFSGLATRAGSRTSQPQEPDPQTIEHHINRLRELRELVPEAVAASSARLTRHN